MKVGLIDYGMGNLRSVQNAFRFLGTDVVVIDTVKRMSDVHALVLPGVGAFGKAMANLIERGFAEALEREVRERGRPFLGLCLGLQLLAARGFELGEHTGLGWLAGDIIRIPSSPGIRVPHVGWNDVDGTGTLFLGIPPRSAFYFVHSYVLPSSPATTGTTNYAGVFSSAVEQDNIMAVQFHPEKSHRHGLALLKNFLNFAERA